MDAARARWIGYLTMVGGATALVLAPPMVAIKYMTGWAIIPEPFWVPAAKAWLAAAFPTTSPAALWVGFGTGYSVALLLMLVGLLALAPVLVGRTVAQRAGYWLLAGGLALVLPGDAIHSWTWHQNGLTIPTPGHQPCCQHGLRRPHDGHELRHGGVPVAGGDGPAAWDTRILVGVDARPRVPGRHPRVRGASSHHAERRTVAVQRDDGRVRLSGRERPRRSAECRLTAVMATFRLIPHRRRPRAELQPALSLSRWTHGEEP